MLKTMDQNRDGRVTEEDILSLCRRYLSCEKRPIAFTPMVEERLAVARRLFKQFDVEKKGILTEKQVPNLLS
jgi:Ca2+-binding EF-hand superfamily protein